MSKHRITAYLYLTIASIIWGIGGPLIKNALTEIPPLVFLTYRFTIITVFSVWFIATQKPKLPRTPKSTLLTALSGFLMVPIGLTFSFYAFERSSTLSVMTIFSLAPIIMIVLGVFFLKERISQMERLGIVVTLLGTLLIILDPILSGGTRIDLGSFSGNLFALVNVIVGSIGALFAKIVLRGNVDPFAVSLIGFMIGLAFVGPLMLYLYDVTTIIRLLTQASPLAHAGVWYMATLGSLIAFGITNIAVKYIDMSESALFKYLTPVWAAPLSLFWLGERVTPLFASAAAIVVAGIIIAELRAGKKARIHPFHRHHI